MDNNDNPSFFDPATSRSSAKRALSVVSKFNNEKRKLVEEISFQGILDLPQINKVDRKLTVSLLSKVDIARHEITIGGNVTIQINDVNVQKILAIPCGPRNLVGLPDADLQEKMDFIKFAIGSIAINPEETCSVKVAEAILSMEYPNGMNQEESDRFKVSFVVFVTGHFLIAKPRTNHGIQDYWGALLLPCEIAQYNFCSFVADELIESARKVQSELRLGRPVKNVTGCTLVLQVNQIMKQTLFFTSVVCTYVNITHNVLAGHVP